MKKFLKDKKKLIIALVLVLGVVGWFSYPTLATKYRFYKVKKAMAVSGAYPVQLGLKSVTQMQCTVSCNGGCCTGGQLCSTLTVADCPKTIELSGQPVSGSQGMAGLFPVEAVTMAGVSDQLIAGMTSVTLPSGNICLAGAGGCSGSCCN